MIYRQNAHFVFAVMALCFVAHGCADKKSDYKFSGAIEGGSDPVAAFRNDGLTISAEAEGERIRNPAFGYGWQSWCGTVTSNTPPLTCKRIAELIRDDLKHAVGGMCLDELAVRSSLVVATKPLTGMLRYNKDQMHGDVFVWLIPDQTDGSIHYSIFIREDPLIE